MEPAPTRSLEQPVRQHSRIYTILKSVGWSAGSITGLIVLFLLALQINPFGAGVAQIVLGWVNPYQGTTIRFEQLRGNFLTNLELRDIRIIRIDSLDVDTLGSDEGELASNLLLQIDTVRARYNPLSLLKSQIHVHEIYLTGPAVQMRQHADSTWDLLAPFLADTTTETTQLRLDRFTLTGANVSTFFYAPGRDSSFLFNDLNIHLHDLILGDNMQVRLDTLWGRFRMMDNPVWKHLQVGADLIGREFTLTGLRLVSPRSLVTGSGTLRLPDTAYESIDDIDFVIKADPLSLADLHPFVTGMDTTQWLRIDTRIQGNGRLVDILAGGTMSDGGSFSLDAQVTPQIEADVSYQLSGQIQDFNPAFFVRGDTSLVSRINIDVQIELQGSSLAQLNGSGDIRLFDSYVGDKRPEPSTIESTFLNGEATIQAQAGLQGSMLMLTGTSRPFDETPDYDLVANFRHIDIGAFLAERTHSSDINGSLHVDGLGSELNSANVTAGLTIDPSTINAGSIESGEVELRLNRGELNVVSEILLPGGNVLVNGEARFDDQINYSLKQFELENINFASLLGLDEEGVFSGGMTLTGEGIEAQTLNLQADLSIRPSFYDTYRVSESDWHLSMQEGRVELSAGVFLEDAGSIQLAATGRPFSEIPEIQLTRGTFSHIDIGTLQQNPDISTDLVGELSLDIQDFLSDNVYVKSRLDILESRINEQTIETSSLVTDLQSGQLDVQWTVELPDGSVSLSGYARPFIEQPLIRVTEGTFEGVNMGAFLGNPSLDSNLNGSFSLASTGLDPASIALTSQCILEPSRFNKQNIEAGTLITTLNQGRLDVSAEVRTPAGESHLVAVSEPFREIPYYRINEGTFQGINVGAFTGDPTLNTVLNGSIVLEGHGFVPESMTLDSRLVLLPSSINFANVQRGFLEATLHGGLLSMDLDVTIDDEDSHLNVVGRPFDDRPGYSASGELNRIPITDLMSVDTLHASFSLDFDLEGEGYDPATMILDGSISSDYATFESSRIGAFLTHFYLEDGLLQVDSLTLRSDFADASGQGRMALVDTKLKHTSDFTFDAEVKTLAPAKSFFPGQRINIQPSTITAQVYGQPGILRFDALTRINSLVYQDFRVAFFEGRLIGELDSTRSISRGEISGRAEYLSIPQFVVEESNFNGSYAQDDILFDTETSIDREHDALVAGRITLYPDSQHVSLETIDLRFGPDRWQLQQEALVTIGETYRVRDFNLLAGDQRISMNGRIDPEGVQQFQLDIESFRLGAISDLLSLDQLDGLLSANLEVSGPAETPLMDGLVEMTIGTREEIFGDLLMDLHYGDQKLSLETRLTDSDQNALLIAGFIPVDIQLTNSTSTHQIEQDIALTLETDGFSLDWARPFLDPVVVSEIEGRIVASVALNGTMDQPQFEGTAQIGGGRLKMPEFGVDYSNIYTDFHLTGQQIELRSASLSAGEGSMTASGTISFADLTLGEFDIQMIPRSFQAVNATEYKAVINGLLSVSGTFDAPVLEGDLGLISANFYLPEEATGQIEQVTLTDEDLSMLEQQFGLRVTEADTVMFDFYTDLTMDLNVSLERDTWLRSRANPKMDVQFTGDLDLQKQPGEDAQVFGSIEVIPVRSHILQFGKRFDVTEGQITFNGPPTDPIVNFGALYEVHMRGHRQDDLLIRLDIDGRLENLELTLSSENPAGLELVDIVSYIATGRPASQSLQLGGQDNNSTALGASAGLALNQVAGWVEGVAGSELGLDVIEIDQDGLKGTTITAGKYVRPWFYVSVSQPITFGNNAYVTSGADDGQNRVFTMELEFYEWLMLRVLTQGSDIRSNLLWEYTY